MSAYLAELQLRIPKETSSAKLESFLAQAEAEVRNARNYGDDTILTEARWKYTIIELAEWHYNHIGVEGETSHSEGDIDSKFQKKDEILMGISSIARAI